MRKRSKFSLSHYRLFSARMGYLVPIGLVECLPGDTFQHATSLFLRVSPLVTPVMHPVHVTIHHWYIPTRLLWDSWEDFITGGPDGMNASVMPTITAPAQGGFAVGSLADYLGVPTGIPSLEVMALPFRAYDLLYNECYRDQDLEQALTVSLEDGPDTTTATDLQRCDWARDYFTTARPWPQKGPQVTVPVNTPGSMTFNVTPNPDDPSFKLGVPWKVKGTPDGTYEYRDKEMLSFVTRNPAQFTSSQTRTSSPAITQVVTDASSDYIYFPSDAPLSVASAYGPPLRWPQQTGLQVSMGGAETGNLGSVDINQLREAFALQRFEEHRALYGSRYVEYLRYLGVRSSDARLQRPEYLGGSRQTIQFSEVLQTAEGTEPVGTLRGHGIGASRTPRYRRFFEEHGYVISRF